MYFFWLRWKSSEVNDQNRNVGKGITVNENPGIGSIVVVCELYDQSTSYEEQRTEQVHQRTYPVKETELQ